MKLINNLTALSIIFLISITGCSNKQTVSSETPAKAKFDISTAVPATVMSEQKTYYEDGKLKDIISLNDGVEVRRKTFKYYPEGYMFIEQEFVGEQADGIFKKYYENGELFVQSNYKNNMLNGEAKYYRSNGTLESHVLYINDLMHGESYSFDEKGRRSKHYFYAKGELIKQIDFLYGESEVPIGEILFDIESNKKIGTLFYPSGKVSLISEYSFDGVKNGVEILYDVDGLLVEKYTYKSGVLNGPYFSYYPSGSIKSKLMYVDALKQGKAETFTENGSLKSVAVFNKNLVEKIDSYYVTGQINSEAFYRNEEIYKYLEYTKLGSVLSDYTYTGEKSSGVSRQFFDSGELSWEMTYKDDLITKAYQYYKGGNLACEVDFKNGKAIKGTKYTVDGEASPMTNAHFHNNGFEY